MSSETAAYRYGAGLAQDIETRWQARWAAEGTFRTPNPGEPGFDSAKPKFYCLDMFPYPSGAGLHVGHPEGYTATDIICRYKRMKGFNVLHPMGWDAFGLPAEQYAIQTGVHPSITTRKAIETFRGQLQRFGFSYDWSREIATIDPGYYKWTQWIFLKLYDAWYDERAGEGGRARPVAELIHALEHGVYGVDPSGELVATSEGAGGAIGIVGEPVGVRRWHELTQEERRGLIDSKRLAYIAEQTVNWCPKLGTALANEEVKADGRSERGDHPVFKKKLKQWMFRITAYAGRLLKDLDGLDWPESTRTMQREWIGRSEGAEIDFDLQERDGSLRVYTTRPDTVFGATYMVVAPEHPLVDEVLSGPPAGADVGAIGEYVAAARNRADVDRMAEGKDKTGVFSGLHAVNPATGKPIPIWIADYVLMGYGHGAIMAVPAHDERDYEFAAKFGVPIVEVVYPRIVAAMRYFADHGAAPAGAPERWSMVLADFLAQVTSANVPPSRFGEALAGATERRGRDEPLTCDLDPATAERELTGLGRVRKDVTRLTWMEAIEDLGIGSLEDLRARFARGRFDERGGAMTGEGFAANSSNAEVSLDGLPTAEARERLIAWLEKTGAGRRKVNYKLRDWLFSRQRYWGEPFPIVWDERGDHHAVDASALPVALPEMKEYRPPESDDPQPMLAAATAWLKTTAGAAGVKDVDPATPVRREANTMPNWAGSCWYYLRFCDPGNGERFVSREAERYWMGDGGVDLYIGGSEHAVLHLLYARFWHKVLFDLGEVGTSEPMRKLFHQGLITSYAFQMADGSLVPSDQVYLFRYSQDGGGHAEVLFHDEKPTHRVVDSASLPEAVYQTLVEKQSAYVWISPKSDMDDWKIAEAALVQRVTAKMSKSLKNVVNPDDVIAEFGADTMRLYEMYMGPLEASKPWNPRDITGLFRFLQRAWRMVVDEQTGEARPLAQGDEKVERELHRTIAKLGPQIEKLSFNTAIAELIKFVNAAGAGLSRSQAERFALVLSPFAPHLAEEMWAKLGRQGSLAYEPWPAYDEAMLHDASVEIPVQVSGKLRGRIIAPAGADAKTLEAAALADPKIKEHLEGKAVAKVIVIPGKLVNIVAK